MIVMAMSSSAGADWQWSKDPDANADIREWFNRQKLPDIPTASCCGEGDAYLTDKQEIVGLPNGKTEVRITITDDRQIDGRVNRNGQTFVIPPNKLYENPAGEFQKPFRLKDPVPFEISSGRYGLVFISRETGGLSSQAKVLCFYNPPGGN